jgi:hypothetical protein
VWRFLASLEMTEKGCRPEPTFLSPRAQARGPSALARLGMTKREARLGRTSRAQARGPLALTRLGMTGWGMSPRAEPRGPSALACSPFLVTPRRKPRGLPVGRRPERCEGCLAIARQDNKKDAQQDNKKDARQDKVGGTFLNSLKGCLTLRMD